MPPTACRKSAQINDASGSFSRLLLHLHPRRVSSDTIALIHTWGLGGMALLLILLQLCSGLLLLFVYRPNAGDAYQSIVSLREAVVFGGFFRNIHYWSANLLVFVTFLHMLRVFYTGAFHGVRAFNWIIGLVLFGLVLSSNFTGYLLPWDQLAYWAVTISTGMLDYLPVVGGGIRQLLLGGTAVGDTTLSNFFVLHVLVLPVCFGVLLPFHFWRIRKAKGVIRPKRPDGVVAPLSDIGSAMVPASPDLVVRELTAAAVLLAVVFLLAACFDAPLHLPANPGLSPDPTKAPWYFAAAQELLVYFHPFVASVLIPFSGLLFLVIVPYLPFREETAGIWLASRQGRKTAGLAALATLVFGGVIILLDAFVLNGGDSTAPSAGGWAGILFLAGAIGAIGAALFIAQKQKRGGIVEAVQFLFTMMLIFWALLTLVGVWFRGPGMALMWTG